MPSRSSCRSHPQFPPILNGDPGHCTPTLPPRARNALAPLAFVAEFRFAETSRPHIYAVHTRARLPDYWENRHFSACGKVRGVGQSTSLPRALRAALCYLSWSTTVTDLRPALHLAGSGYSRRQVDNPLSFGPIPYSVTQVI
ncbi:hypothetical protein CGRA01v4_00134 [Colletotrichum graminicola]|nr:hypothetical protein CGRA01v4_00134 [Colletotrichum graminicola]